MIQKLLTLFLAGLFTLAPTQAGAAMYAPFEISGWIPYWRMASGTQQFLEHIDTFKEINPFGYTVKSDGTLYDQMELSVEPWPLLGRLLDLKEIRLIPTIMWSDGQAIHNVLSDPAKRSEHVRQIVDEVRVNHFDGIDIDYEAKFAKTQPYFSLFIKELSIALRDKWLMCTIEARTPADARRNPTPDDPRDYANDYATLAQYCDRVRVMAYDQASIDRTLNLSTHMPYVPVSDVRWVEKVMQLAMQSIPREKLMIGVATYGYEYKVTPLTSGYDYKFLWAFNQGYATKLAFEQGLTPSRNVAGELSFTYRPAESPFDSSFHILWWSDAGAIKDKLDLAQRLGVRGISIFKIDGGPDPALWDVLPK